MSKRLIIAVYLLLVMPVYAGSDCIYADSNIDPSPLLKNKILIDAQWDATDKKLSARTRDGERLEIRYWACENYSLEARLFIPRDGTDEKKINSKLIWLARLVLASEDASIVADDLQRRAGGFPTFLSGVQLPKLMINVEEEVGQLVLIVFCFNMRCSAH